MKAFEKYMIKDMKLENRIVMPPMCMYSSDNSGEVKEFHTIHYNARALGGTGLIIQEATAVESRGRISDRDLGIWDDSHLPGLKNLVESLKSYGSKVGIQLAHAGRKCGIKTEDVIAPSALAFSDDYLTPRSMTKEDIDKVVMNFKLAAKRSLEAGYDLIEIHGAHGYLIHEFLSPLTNQRNDEYGGSIENRVRLLREISKEVKSVWPEDKPLILRISASDYAQGGIDIDEMIRIIDLVKSNFDMIHVSSGGLVLTEMNVYPGYQVVFSEKIRERCNIPTISVGLIKDIDHVEDILNNHRSDLVALGRELLRNPNWVLNEQYKTGEKFSYPDQYFRAYR